MKTLLLFPKKYSFSKTFKNILNSPVGNEVIEIDYRKQLKKWETKFNTQVFRFPDKYRLKWENYFLSKINEFYKSQVIKHEPTVIYVYNNEMLLPSTTNWIKRQGIKLFFFLGDPPFFTPTNRYNLTILEDADGVFVPDTFWQFQLKKAGLKNVEWLIPPLPNSDYFPIDQSNIENNIPRSEVLYVGMCYKNSWGYKKAKFVNEFTDYNLKIYGGNDWRKWIQFFPEIENYLDSTKGFIPVETLNKMFNCTKIVPVDGNPAILNGMHVRITEALAAGVLPLAEYTEDYFTVFKGIENLPLLKSTDDIKKHVDFFLENETLRLKLVSEMKEQFNSQFNEDSMYKKLTKFN